MKLFKIEKWQIWTAISFFALSTIVYVIHYLIFKDLHYLVYYFLIDLGFVFIQVFLVSFILENHLEKREVKARIEKLNMVIGVFFSEIGVKLLSRFTEKDLQIANLRNELLVNNSWTSNTFNNVKSNLKNYPFELNLSKDELISLKAMLVDEKKFLLGILENPTLH